jgi:Icc-related predicted phosphoesterase
MADTHMFFEDLTVPPGDLLVHAGDHARGGSLSQLEEAAAWLGSLPHRHKVAIAGNHDWAFVRTPRQARALFERYGIHYLEDEELCLEGLRFWGTPWQPEYNEWAFNLPRGEALARKWALIPRGLDVLISHGPPQGIGDGSSMGPQRAGCADLRARVEAVQPRLHLFGHIHEAGGAWRLGATTYVNCTTWECERGCTVIELAPGEALPELSLPPELSAW